MSDIKRILFYTHSPRAFRSTLIGHLYELCQHFPTVLLSEVLDAETEAVLRRRELFPRLEAIVPVHQFTGGPMPAVARNRYLYQVARDTITRYRPDVVLSASDMHSLFELYLFRFAKRIRARTITFQTAVDADDPNLLAYIVDLENAYARMSAFLPRAARLALVRAQKRLGHLLYHWVFPILVGELPLVGRSSYILRRGNSGMRDADYHVVLSRRDLQSCLRAGVPAGKIRILSHPWGRQTRTFFEVAYQLGSEEGRSHADGKRVLAILPGGEIGFRRPDFLVISRGERRRRWEEIVRLVLTALPGWMVRVKPHPDSRDMPELKARFERLSPRVQIVDPASPVEWEIARSTVIVGLPRSSSTALLTAVLQCPEKPVISVDLEQEVLGDVYRGVEGIEYVTSRESLEKLLGRVRDGAYGKPTRPAADGSVHPGEFSTTVEAVTTLFRAESTV